MNELWQHRVAVRHELSLEACGREPKGDQSAHVWVVFFSRQIQLPGGWCSIGRDIIGISVSTFDREHRV